MIGGNTSDILKTIQLDEVIIKPNKKATGLNPLLLVAVAVFFFI